MPALVLRNDFLHNLDDGHVVESLGDFHQAALVFAGGLVVIFAGPGHLDFRIGGREGTLAVIEHLLVELLSVAESGELDFHIGSSGKLDHALGQIHDLHRLAHVEDEDFPALAHGAGLENQFAGLRDEHEEADDVRMGDGDRTAVRYLLLEDRDHAAVGAEDIAEAGGHELGHALDLARLDGLAEALAVDFADSLAAAHHVGRIHGLVGGYHHEFLRAVLDGQVGDDPGAVDIVLDSYGRVVLHHRNVLVGSCMEDVFRPVFSEYLLHVPLVGNAGDNGEIIDVGVFPGHHKPDVVHRRLGLVDENHPGWLEPGHLADHLGADRAGRSGDEDAFSGQQGPYGIHVHLDLVPRKEVFHVHFMQLAMAQGVVLAVPFLGRRHHHDLDAGIDELVHHLLVLAEAVTLERRHEQDLDALGLELPGEAGFIVINRLAHHVGALHVQTVGDE